MGDTLHKSISAGNLPNLSCLATSLLKRSKSEGELVCSELRLGAFEAESEDNFEAKGDLPSPVIFEGRGEAKEEKDQKRSLVFDWIFPRRDPLFDSHSSSDSDGSSYYTSVGPGGETKMIPGDIGARGITIPHFNREEIPDLEEGAIPEASPMPDLSGDHRKNIISGLVSGGATLGIYMVFSAGTIFVPVSALIVSAAAGYSFSKLAPLMYAKAKSKYQDMTNLTVKSTLVDANRYKQTARSLISNSLGIVTGGAVIAMGGGVPLAVIAGGTVTGGAKTVIDSLPGKRARMALGYYADRSIRGIKFTPSTDRRPETMHLANRRRIYQNGGKKIASIGVGLTVGVLALASGGMLIGAASMLVSYIGTERIIGTFINNTTTSEKVPSLTNIGDILGRIGRAGSEIKGVSWSIPTLIASKAFNDKFAKMALEGGSAVNFALSVANTSTAIRLMKTMPPEQIDRYMKILDFKHRIRRSILWGTVFNIILFILVFYVVIPTKFKDVKLSSSAMVPIFIAGEIVMSFIARGLLHYLDRLHRFLVISYSKCCHRFSKAKKQSIYLEGEDILIVNWRLLKDAQTTTLQSLYKDAEFVQPGNKSILLSKEELTDEVIEDFNNIVVKNWNVLTENRKKKVIQLLLEDDRISIRNVSITYPKEGNIMELDDQDDSKETILANREQVFRLSSDMEEKEYSLGEEKSSMPTRTWSAKEIGRMQRSASEISL